MASRVTCRGSGSTCVSHHTRRDEMIRDMRLPWAWILAAGCYQPAPAPGAPCNRAGDCPDPLTCVRGTCEVPVDGVDAADDACAGGPAPSCVGVVPSNGVAREWVT